MKHIIIFLSTFSIVLSATSQDPVFAWSRAERKAEGTSEARILGHTGEGYFVLAKKPMQAGEFSSTLFVEYFSNAHVRGYSVNVTPSSMHDVVGVEFLDGRVYMFSALFSKDEGKYTLFAAPLGPKGELQKAVVVQSIPVTRLVDRGNFRISCSPDRENLLVLYQPEFKKDENEKIELTVYDKKFSRKWNREYTLPYPWKRGVNNDPLINNSGTVFIMKRLDMKGYDQDYTIFSFDGKGSREFKIEMEGKRKARSILPVISPAGELIVGGYFTEESKVGVSFGINYQGSFMQKIDPSGASVVFNVINPFTQKRKDLVVKNILPLGDKTVLVGEQYWVNVSSGPRDPSNLLKATDNSTFYGKEIWLDGYDGTGKVLYSTSIEKDNTSKADNGTSVSFFSVLLNNKVALIYNDYGYKHDGKKHVVVAAPSKIPVLSYVNAETGQLIETKGLFDSNGVGGRFGDMLMRPDVFLKLDETHYLIRAENVLNYKMGSLSF